MNINMKLKAIPKTQIFQIFSSLGEISRPSY